METDLFERLELLMNDIMGKDKVNTQQTDEMFNLNNLIYPDLKEFNKACPACRERVYKRLCSIYVLEKENRKKN